MWEVNAEYLTDEGKHVYGLYKASDKEVSDSFAVGVREQFSERAKDGALEQELAIRAQIRRHVFGDRPAPEVSIPTQMINDKKRSVDVVAVKKENFEAEKAETWKRAKLQAGTSVLDLDSSPEKTSPVALPPTVAAQPVSARAGLGSFALSWSQACSAHWAPHSS